MSLLLLIIHDYFRLIRNYVIFLIRIRPLAISFESRHIVVVVIKIVFIVTMSLYHSWLLLLFTIVIDNDIIVEFSALETVCKVLR